MSIIGKVFCEKKGKYRAAFKTREKAGFFIKNFARHMEGVDIEFKPVRSFYCVSCNKWHITHIPLSPESEWTEERDRKVQELQTLAERPRVEFRQADWKAWKPLVEDGLNLLDLFKERECYEKLVEDTGKHLRHCAAIIKTSEAKESGSADEDFKRMRKGIEHSAKALDYDSFESEAYQLVSYFRDACQRKALKPSNVEWLTQITVCMEDDETMDVVCQVMELASQSVPDSRQVEADDLYKQVLDMTLGMDRLFVLGLPRTVWDILQSKVKKIVSVLDNSFGSDLSPDGYLLKEKVRIVANERMLKDASDALSEGDKELAMEILLLLDARMGQLSLSKKKVELMRGLCEIGERLYD